MGTTRATPIVAVRPGVAPMKMPNAMPSSQGVRIFKLNSSSRTSIAWPANVSLYCALEPESLRQQHVEHLHEHQVNHDQHRRRQHARRPYARPQPDHQSEGEEERADEEAE